MTFSYVSIDEYFAEIESRPMPSHLQAFSRLVALYDGVQVIKNENGIHKILNPCADHYADSVEMYEREDGIVFARPFLSIETIQVFTPEYELCVGHKKATGFGYEMSPDLADTVKAIGWHSDLFKMIKDWFAERQPAEYLVEDSFE